MDGEVLLLADQTGTCARLIGCLSSVSVSEEGTEDRVVGKDRWEELKRMCAQGLTVSEIA